MVSQRERRRAQLALRFHRDFSRTVFFTLAMVAGASGILIRISLMTHDLEHLFTCTRAISIFSFETSLQIVCPFGKNMACVSSHF